MRTLFDEADRRRIVERLERLAPTQRPLWGKMTAPKMVPHCTDALGMALGTIPAKPKRLPIRYFPLKQLIVYWLPFPKGSPTAPELLARVPEEWDKEVAQLESMIASFATREPGQPWPEHPAFGRLSPRGWGVLTYRHLDHHFRQFGI